MMNKFPTGSNLDSLVKRVAFNSLHTGTEGILPTIIDNTPIKSGTMRRSQIVTPHHERMTVSISANTPYALAVHEGSKPHDIVPVNKKALAFKVGGRTIFAKKVHHPGNKGNPWMRNTVEEELDKVGKYVTAQVTKSIQEELK